MYLLTVERQGLLALFFLGIQNKLIFPLLISSNFIISSNIILMASTFYIFHHEFKAGKAEKWWETAYAAMSPSVVLDQEKIEN